MILHSTVYCIISYITVLLIKNGTEIKCNYSVIMGQIFLKFDIQCYISPLHTHILKKLEIGKIDFFKHKMIVKFSEKATVQLGEGRLEIKYFLA